MRQVDEENCTGKVWGPYDTEQEANKSAQENCPQ